MSGKRKLSFETRILFILFSIVITAFLALFAYEIVSSLKKLKPFSLHSVTASELAEIQAQRKNQLLVLAIDAGGRILRNDNEVRPGELNSLLIRRGTLVLLPDRECPAAKVDEAVSAARAAGVKEVLLVEPGIEEKRVEGLKGLKKIKRREKGKPIGYSSTL